jgi:hypothetical protein
MALSENVKENLRSNVHTQAKPEFATARAGGWGTSLPDDTRAG